MLHYISQIILIAILLNGLHGSSASPTKPSPPSHNNPPPQWTRHPPLGLGPRQEHGVAALNSTLFVLGGVHYNANSTIQTVNTVEYLSLRDQPQNWRLAAPLPRPLNHPNTIASTTQLYLLGSLSANPTNWTAQPETYAYSLHNDTWTALAPMPPTTARGAAAVGLYNDTIYIAGGQAFLELLPPYRQPGLTTVSSYNINSNSWDTTLPALPQARQHVSGAVVGSVFYVFGGREGDIASYRNTTYALDLEDLDAGWREMAPMPTARGSLACAAAGRVVYCLGGEGDESNERRIFGEVEVYDTVADSWEALPPMELPRHGAGAVFLDGRIWVPGGGVRTMMAPVGVVDSLGVWEGGRRG